MRAYGVNVLNEGAERRNKMRTTHTQAYTQENAFSVFMSTQQPESKRAVKESFSAMWTNIFVERHINIANALVFVSEQTFC